MQNKNNHFRTEIDSIGEIKIPSKRLYGPQTKRAMENFPNTINPVPKHLIKYYAAYKYAAIKANINLNMLDKIKGKAMLDAALKIFNEELEEEFVLTIWQSGSGTQTNMNLNEVIANQALKFLNKDLGSKNIIHPNDMVNLHQSSNDSFAIAMHLSAYFKGLELLKINQKLITILSQKSVEFKKQNRISRTHLQDAVMMPGNFDILTFQKVFKEYNTKITKSLKNLLCLPIGGSAIGTGINVHKDFPNLCQKELENFLQVKLELSKYPACKIASHDALLDLSSDITNYASVLQKLANDIRLLSCGPVTGLGEVIIPSNEPGSSIMPGKVNPSLAESLKMACITVSGYHQIILNCNSQGDFQLNVNRPTLIYHLLHSLDILTHNVAKFSKGCLKDMHLNKDKIKTNIENSLMQVTKLVPIIGYDKAASLAKYAHENKLSLKKANQKMNFVDNSLLNKLVALL